MNRRRSIAVAMVQDGSPEIRSHVFPKTEQDDVSKVLTGWILGNLLGLFRLFVSCGPPCEKSGLGGHLVSIGDQIGNGDPGDGSGRNLVP